MVTQITIKRIFAISLFWFMIGGIIGMVLTLLGF